MSKLLLVGIFSLLVAAAPANDLKTFEVLHSAPEGWNAVGTPAHDARLVFKIALRAEKRNALETLLKEVSDPTSAKYGHFLSIEEVNAKLKPSVWAKQSVRRWLKASGIDDVKENTDEMQFTASVQQANGMMNTEFLRYRHAEHGSEAIRTTSVHLPQDVAEHVSMIHPTTKFENMQALRSVIHKVEVATKQPAQDCRYIITPECLKDLYNIRGINITNPDPSKLGVLGIAGFLSQYAQFGDLELFLKNYTKVSGNFSWTSINDGQLPQFEPRNKTKSHKTEEANLDIQYTMALTSPMKNEFLSTGGSGPWVADNDQPLPTDNQNEPYYEFFDNLLKRKTRPHTVSFSYGESEHSVPPSYAKTVCDQIGKLGLLGVSVIFASGDLGVGSHCLANDGSKKTRFMPIFPAACPWATAVGGTRSIEPEEAYAISSGGFSDLWSRPWYQQSQVKAYLQKHSPKNWEKFFTKSGRGFPDMAAQGKDFRIVNNMTSINISGTSASAPVVAAIIALLNAERLQTGQPPLGFLNPWIYQRGQKMLNDITTGASSGCYGSKGGPFVNGAKWAAVQGWDPVTGMGTPDMKKMLRELPKRGTAKPKLLSVD